MGERKFCPDKAKKEAISRVDKCAGFVWYHSQVPWITPCKLRTETAKY